MKKGLLLVACWIATACATTPATPMQRADWNDVATALGKSGSMQPGNVYKVGFPRSDLAVRIDDVQLKPGLALGSWAAFLQLPQHAMVMGDLVLTEDEVNPVISALQAGGIEQTALHNHVLRESPRVMYLHFGGHGDPVALARALRTALEKTKTPFAAGGAPATTIDLPTAELDAALGASGKINGGAYQFAIARAERTVEHGVEIPPAAGMAIAINFQPTSNGRAAISGDFILLASEVNPVIRELRAGGIDVTALHSHMLDEEPRFFFMHFWANDDALKLARALRAAVDRTNRAK
jgi:uncharacterized protein DUF1259